MKTDANDAEWWKGIPFNHGLLRICEERHFSVFSANSRWDEFSKVNKDVVAIAHLDEMKPGNIMWVRDFRTIAFNGNESGWKNEIYPAFMQTMEWKYNDETIFQLFSKKDSNAVIVYRAFKGSDSNNKKFGYNYYW